ncbi:MAG: hypothetical protein CMO61_02275 [Verrucomicrobiales bacterium]|jgi:2-succinyl-6-hydroxy-2,4-cyclohexadiene-1-carboxylate synthase|nr:hypothetical protein [Verrucomicrobiales bacterium]|tara:strand:+ start:1177 stop:1866 length:690 start_codon:yes stop_codon:yes gene_type:complete
MSAPTVIALHGNLGSTNDWQRLEIEGMVAVDLWSFSGMSLEEFARVLTEEIRPKGERPVIAGYSLGGRLALQAMALFPEAWAGAVILSAHPGLQSDKEREERLDIDDNWARKAQVIPWPEFLKEWNSHPVLASSPSSEEQLGLEGRRAAISRAFHGWSLGTQSDLREPLKRFTHPVLWITGARDVKFHKLGEEMSEVFSKFEHMGLPERGHRVLDPLAAIKIQDWLDHL